MSLADEFNPSTLDTLKRYPVCNGDAGSSEQIAEDFIELFGTRQSSQFSLDAGRLGF